MKKHAVLKRLFVSLLPFLFLAILCGCAGNKEALKDKSQTLLRLGVSYFREGDTAAALKEFEEARKLTPKDPQIYNVLGVTYLKMGKHDKAMENLNRALELNPEFSEAHNNLGTVYLDMKQWDNAIEEFRKALGDDLYATPERAYCNIGWAFYKKGDIGQAIDNYKKAVEIVPAFVLAHYNLGIGYLSIGRLEKALEEFKLAVKHNPEYIDAHYQLGLVYFKLGKKEEAIEEFKKVIKIDPENEASSSAQRYVDLLK